MIARSDDGDRQMVAIPSAVLMDGLVPVEGACAEANDQNVDSADVILICPIRNVGLKVVPDMAAHPLRRLCETAIHCTVSTDDPLLFGNTLSEEYLALAHGLGFSRRELARLARNGFEVALLYASQMKPWLDRLDAIIGR